MGFYRTEQKSVWDSVRTVFSLHNETGNVWTHFLGAYDPHIRACSTVVMLRADTIIFAAADVWAP